MTEDQLELLQKAEHSLSAARLLFEQGYTGFAASRAYYTMFYVVEAFLEGEGLSFSKHSAVIAAFGQHFVRAGKIPAEFHRYLIEAEGLRHSGDYGGLESVTRDQSSAQIDRAQRFVELAKHLIGQF